jgi:hypothetical protein
MSEIAGVVNEMRTICSELKRLRSETQKLNKRKTVLEKKIVEYLEVKEELGLKFNGVAILKEEKERRAYKKKSEKLERGTSLLENYGIDNPKEVLDELMNCMKGSPIQESKIKIKEIKKR